MGWKQVRACNINNMGKRAGYCLANVQSAFSVPASLPSALAALQENRNKGTLHSINGYPTNVAVPVFIDSTSQYEHIGILYYGQYYSDGVKATLPTSRCFGWGEILEGVRIVSSTGGGTGGGGTVWNGVNYAAVFDLSYYLNKYPDVKAEYGNNAFEHFTSYGMKEHRQAISSFNVDMYKANYADLRNAFGDNIVSYYTHYCTNGKSEGRNAISDINAKPSNAPKSSGTATCTANEVKIRTAPNTSSGDTGYVYKKGMTLNYSEVVDSDGYYWLKYKSNSGAIHYCAYGKVDGSATYWTVK